MSDNEVSPRKGDEEEEDPPLCDVRRKERAKYRGRDGFHRCESGRLDPRGGDLRAHHDPPTLSEAAGCD